MFSKKDIIISSCIMAFTIAIIFVIAFIFSVKTNADKIEKLKLPITARDIGTAVPYMSEDITEEDYNTFVSTSAGSVFDTYYDFSTTASCNTTTSADSTITATGYNKKLYDIADKNFIVFYGYQRVSPILPLAMANVETNSRANRNLTWSALFPSRYIDPELMETADVTTVVSSDAIFQPLSSEMSTRDRGALQMSPTYGTKNKEINAKMSGNEKDKLAKSGDGGHSGWASGASSESGDRFFVNDVCLRLSAAMSSAIADMSRVGALPDSDMMLIVQLALYHNNSGVWYYKQREKSIGTWNSGQAAYDWAKIVSSQEVVTTLSDYAANNPDKFVLGNEEALNLVKKSHNFNVSDYATRSTTLDYPVKVLYAYIKLCMMYTQ